MFKFATKLEKGHLIGLGFEEGNLVMLKAGKPIRIDWSDFRFPWPGGVIVAYPTPEVEALKNRLPPCWSLIKLNDDAMAVLRDGRPIPFEFPPVARRASWRSRRRTARSERGKL